ncbi:50S ribosomal protein L11 methyltransferase [Halanaerobaculum tunisiense]
MSWQEIQISTTYQAYPAISNLLEELNVAGISKEELTAKEDEVLIKAYFQADIDLTKLQEKISSLQEYDLNIGSGKLKVEEVVNKDWASKWKENFKPLKITDRIVIKPTWEEYQLAEEEIVIDIDPGQAFGTGHHETTESCLQLIEDYATKDISLLDIGTGTGILAIAAAKLGVEEIFALDIAPIAIEAARENAQLNQVAEDIEFATGDLVEVVAKDYELVVANLLPHIILDLIPDLAQVITADSRFILSGIIVEKEEQIKDKLEEYGFIINKRVQQGEWVTLVGGWE